MNARSFKVIFSKRLGALVAVGENATSQGKSASGEGARGAALAAAVFLSGLSSAYALDPSALPSGHQVAAGQVQVTTSGARMDIGQLNNQAIVNWQSFNVGSGAAVHIQQPSATSVLLNRVVGNDMSQIRGQINANGQVVLVNPNGIVMGPTGRITASAFTASTFGISDANFLAGKLAFERNGSDASVVNEGSIQTTGEAGGYIALIGASVSNQGTIASQGAGVALASGERATVSVPLSGKVRLELDPAAFGSANVANSGVIQTSGGQVLLRAAAVVDAISQVADARVSHTGSIDTSGAQGGRVDVLADHGTVRVSGTVTTNSISGAAGGDVFIGRDEQTNTLAAVGDASGAQIESKGGFVETSGHALRFVDTTVVAQNWLLDPANITIDNTNVGSIQTSLNAGTGVTMQTTGSAGDGLGDGNITVATDISKTAGTDATLTLKAHNDIVINSDVNITSTTGKLNVVLNSDLDGNGAGAIAMSSGSSIESKGGNITLGGGSAGDGSGHARGYNNNTRFTGVALTGATLSAAGGNISIKGRGIAAFTNTSDLRGVNLDATTVSTTGAGTVTIDGIGGNGNVSLLNVGIGMINSAKITADTGAITLTGTSPTAAGAYYNSGIWIYGNGSTVTGAGTISLTGTGGGSTYAGLNQGIRLEGGRVTATGSGTVTMHGTSGVTSSTTQSNAGIEISGGGFVKSDAGNISITGVTPSAGSTGVHLFTSGKVESNSGNVTLSTNSYAGDNTENVNAGTGTVTIQTQTAGVKIDLGGSDVTTGARTLGLSVAEQGRITAGALVIGQSGANASGTVTVSQNITSANGIKIVSGSDIVLNTDKTITSTGAGKSVVLNSNGSGLANSTGAIVFNSGAGVTTNNGDITLGGGVDGTGAAVGNSNNKSGINLDKAALNANGGNISLKGRSGAVASDFAVGVAIVNGSTVRTSGSSSVTIEGTGAGTGGGSQSMGVRIAGTNATTLSTVSSGSGGINITGTGSSASSTGNYQHGVMVTNAKVSATGGNVSLTGTGGNAGGGNSYKGLSLETGAEVSATGAGTVTLKGTGGKGTGAPTANNAGVGMNSGSLVKTATGAISIEGSAPDNASFGTALAGVIQSTGNANISVTTDSLALSGTVNAGSGTVTVQNQTAGTLITVGGVNQDTRNTTPKTLVVNAAELANITAGTTVIGRNDGTGSGTVTIQATNMGALGNTSGHLTVLSGNDIDVTGAVTKNAGAAADLTLQANNGMTITSAVGSTTHAINVKATANGNSSTDSKGIYLSGSGSIQTAGTVLIDSTSRKTNGWDFTKSALALAEGSSIKGSDVDIQLTVDLPTNNRVYGLFAQNRTSFEASSGNLNIDATLKGAGGIQIGSNTYYSSALLMGSGQINDRVQVKAAGDVKLTGTVANNASANNSGINLVDTAIQAGGHVLIQSTVADASTKAIEVGNGGANLGFSAVSLNQAGNITLKSNQGSIAVGALRSPATGVPGLSGKNITVDNTGGTLTTDANTGLVTLTQGSGVASASHGVALSTSSVNTPAAVVAAGNINLSGVSSAATSNGVKIQSTLQAAQHVTVNGTNTSTSHTAAAVFLDKAVTSTQGTITMNADTAGSTTQSLHLDTGATLTTNDQTITLNTDSIDINTSAAPATINAGTGIVTIQNKRQGVQINVGGNDAGATAASGRTLGLNNNELNRITAGDLVVGQQGTNASGDLTVSANVNTKTTTGNVTLNTGGNLTVNGNWNVGDTSTKDLNLNATGNVGRTSANVRLTADEIRIKAGGFVGEAFSRRLQTSANTLAVQSGGNQWLNELNGTEFAATSTSGDINLTSDSGSVGVSSLIAADGSTLKGITATDKAVTLSVSGGSILNSTGNTDGLITSNALNIEASAHVGQADKRLLTQVNTLALSAGNDIHVAETDGLANMAAISTNGGVNVSTGNGAMTNGITTIGYLVGANSQGITGVTAKTGVNLSTGTGNIWVGQNISNTGSGDVVLAAGTSKAAGDGTGGDIKTTAGKTISNVGGKTYLYTGSVENTGKLSNAVSTLGTLYLSDVGTNKTNTVSKVGFTANHAAAVNGGANTQVFFREAINLGTAVELTSSTVTKTYGDVAFADVSALKTEIVNKIKENNSGVIEKTSTTGAATSIKINASDLVDSLNVSRTYDSATEKSTSEKLKANTDGYAYSLTAGDKYNVTISNNTTTKVVVNKKALNGSIAQGNTTYGDALAAGAVTLDNKVGSDVVSANGVTITTTGLTSTSGKLKAGTHEDIQSVTALTGADKDNYTFAGVKGDYKVDKLALNGSIAQGNTTYGDVLAAGAVTLNNKVGSDVVSANGVTITTTGLTSTSGNLKAGTHEDIQSVTALTGADKDNYTFAEVKGDYKVDKLALNGSIAQGQTTYGEALAAGAVTLNNKVGSDVVSANGVTITTTGLTSTSGNLKAGTHTGVQSVTALTGADKDNYTFAEVKGDYKVDKLALNGSIAQGNTTYGDALAAGAVTLNNKVGSDVVSANGVTITTTGLTSTSGNLKAGTHTGVQSVTALTGADKDNYTFAEVKGDYKVDKLALNGSIAQGNTTYGDALAAGAVTLNNKVGSDVVSANGVTITTTGLTSTSGHLKAGTHEDIQSVTALTGADKDNYTFAEVKGDYKVDKLALNGSIAQGNTTYGDALAAGAVTLNNKVGSDVVSANGVTITTTGLTSTSGKLKAGTHTGVQSVTALTGADKDNYTFAEVKGDYKVDKLALNGSIAQGNTTYGDALAAGAVTLNNKVGSDVVSANGVTITTTGLTSTSGHLKAGTHTGVQSVTALTGADKDNYTFAEVKGDYTVAQKSITTAEITAAGNTYGGNVAAGSVSLGTDAITNDIVSATATIDGATLAVNKSSSGNLKAGAYGQTVATTALAGTDSANYKLEEAVTAANSYTVSQKSITTAEITAAGNTYGDTVAAGSVSLGTDAITNDIVSATATIDGATLAVNKSSSGNLKAGAYGQTVATTALAGTDSPNYKLDEAVTAANSYTVNKLALTGAAIADVTTTYGTAADAGVVSFGNVQGSGSTRDKVTATASLVGAATSTSGNLKAGEYQQTASAITGDDSANYTFSGVTTADKNYTVDKLALSGAAIEAVTTTYGTAADAGVVSFGNVQGSGSTRDKVTATASLVDAATSTSGNLKAGEYQQTATTIDGEDSANYTFSGVTTADKNYTVDKLALSGAAIEAVTTTYGTAADAGVVSFGNVQGSGSTRDKVTATASLVDAATSTSGNLKAGEYQQTATTIDGEDSANYTFSGVTTADKNYTVDKLALSGAAIEAVTTTYGTAADAGVVSFGNVQGSGSTRDKVTATASLVDAATSTSGNLKAGEYQQTATTIDGEDSANYTFSGVTTADKNYTVDKLALSGAAIEAVTTTYGTAAAAGVVSFGNVQGSDETRDKVTATASLVGAATSTSGNLKAGEYQQTASAITGDDSANYTFSGVTTADKNYTVDKLALSGAVIADVNTTYGTEKANGTVSFGNVQGSGATLDKVTATASLVGAATSTSGNLKAGEYQQTATTITGDDSANYTFSGVTTADKNYTVAKKDVTLDSLTATNKTYDGSDAATITAGAISGTVGTETLVISGSGSFNTKDAGTGKTVTVSDVTSLTKANGTNGGDWSNYTLTTTGQKTTTANIAKKDVALDSLTAENKTYDGNTDASITAGAISGTVGTETLAISGSGSFDTKNAGTNKTVTVSDVTSLTKANGSNGGDWSNYNLTTTGQKTTTANIAKKDVALDSLTASNKTYDGNTDATITAGAISGTVGTETLAISGSGSFNTKDAGTGKTVTVSDVTSLTKTDGTGDWDNYNLTTTGQKTTTANITKKGITLSGITAADKVYDGATSATVSTANAVFNDQVSGDNLTVSSTGSFADKNVANDKTVTLSNILGGTDLANYEITEQTSTTADITKKGITLSGITAADKVYDGATSATVSTANAVFNDQVSGDNLTVSSTGSFADKNVANDKTVTLSNILGGTDLGNYEITEQTSTTADITKKGITLSGITAADKVYDGATSATVSTANAVFNDQVSGDNLTVSSSGSFADKNVANDKTVTLSNILGGTDLANYEITEQTSTTADITKKGITLSGITAADKVYDGATSATVSTANAVFNDQVSGDNLTVSSTGSFADKNVANDKTVTLSNILGGTDLGNYEITEQTSTTADITKKGITLSGITAADKVYDGATSATVSTANAVFNDQVSGDNLTVSSTGSFADKNVANDKTVTLSNILGGTDLANYEITEQTSTTADITKKGITLSGITAADKVYDGATSATVSTANAVFNDQVSGDNLTVSSSGSFADKNVANDKTVTLSNILGGTDLGNYEITEQTSTTADITKKGITLSGITAADKVYDGATSATVSTANAVFNDQVSGDNLTVSSTGSFADKNVANDKTVTLSNILGGTDLGNYEITEQTSTTADITKKGITLSGITAADKVYDGATSATVSTANAVFNDQVSGDNLTVSSTGSFADKNVANDKTVTLSNILGGTDLANYEITEQTSTTADITKKGITLSGITAADKVYDGATSATVSTANAVFNDQVSGDDLTVSSSGSFADKNVANDKTVTLSNILGGTDLANYEITEQTSTTADITKKGITLSGITAADKVYDGATSATVSTANAVFNDQVSGDNLTVSSTGSFADKNVANDKTVTLSNILGGTDLGNYEITEQTSTTADITKKGITLSGITAADKVYDGATSATVSTANAVFNDQVSGDNLTVSSTGSFADKNVANDKTVTLSNILGGTDLGNYEITEQTSTTADITKKGITLSGITAADKVYDGATSATVSTANAVFNDQVSGDNLTVSSTGSFADKNVANDKTVTLSNILGGTDLGNYEITEQTSTTADITKKGITLSGITAADKVYDGATSATVSTANAVFNDQVSGDDLTVSSSGSFADKNVANDKTVTLSNILGGTDLGNYEITEQTSTTADITKKGITLSGITAADKVYDGATSATVSTANAVFNDQVSGDNLTVSSTGSFADKNVANDKTVTLSNILGGTDLANYEITEQTSTTADITKKGITLSGITAADKVYDGATSATVSTANAVFNDQVSGDDLTVSSSGSFADKNVANDKTVTLSNILGGTDLGNYEITEQTSTTADITKKGITLSGITAADKVYDGATSATVSTANAVFNDQVSGDDLTVSSSGSFADKNVANDKTVTLSNILGGTDLGNYEITEQTSTTADITKKGITLSGITAADKVYDGATSATVSTANAVFNDQVSGDDLTVSSSGSFADKNVANDKTVTLSNILGGTDLGNYEITEQTSTTADITKKGITINGLSALDKAFDNSTSAKWSGEAELEGKVAGDNLELNVSAANFNSPEVGRNKPVTLTGALAGDDQNNYLLNLPQLVASITNAVEPVAPPTPVVPVNPSTPTSAVTISNNSFQLAGVDGNKLLGLDVDQFECESATSSAGDPLSGVQICFASGSQGKE